MNNNWCTLFTEKSHYEESRYSEYIPKHGDCGREVAAATTLGRAEGILKILALVPITPILHYTGTTTLLPSHSCKAKLKPLRDEGHECHRLSCPRGPAVSE